MNFKLTGTIT